jgi:hypothetical protein
LCHHAAQRPPAAAHSNVAGIWHLANGAFWSIVQSGQQLTIQEVMPGFGVAGTGTGSLQGNTRDISYVGALGARGTGRLQVAPGGRLMSGYLVDQATGQATTVALSR